MKKRSFPESLLPLLALLALWTWFQSPLLFKGRTLILADASTIFYPLWKWGSEAFREGILPLWCPDAGFGTPYLADPQNLAWYPPKLLLYALLAPSAAFTLLLLAHSLWGLLGFWLLARQRGHSPWVALFGCLILGFSINATLLPWSTSMPLAFSWVPWVLLGADRCREGRSLGWFFLSICLAFQWAAGYPLFGYMTGLFLLVDGASGAWKGKGSGSLPRSFLAAGGIAVLFNLAWLLPLAEMLPSSNLSARSGMASWVGWKDLGSCFNPFLLGHPLFSQGQELIFRVLFLGLPPLVILALAALGGSLPARAWGSLGLSLVLLLGEGAGAAWVLKGVVPGYHWIVRSGYWIPFWVLFMALLSMRALQRLMEIPRAKPGVRGLLVTLGIFGTALVLGVPWDLPSFWLSLLACVLALGNPVPGTARVPLLCFGLVLSLLPAARAIHFTADRSFYDQQPRICGVLQGKGRTYQSPEWADRFRTLSGEGVLDAYSKAKEVLAPNWGLAYGIRTTFYSHSLFLMSGLAWDLFPGRLAPPDQGRVLDLLGVGAVSLPEGGLLLRRGASLPLWFSVRKAVPAGDLEGVWGWMTSSKEDLRSVVTIEDPSLAGGYSRREVTEGFRDADRIEIKAKGGGVALLASSEAAYPGWKALVGREERPLLRVDHDFRGLLLGPDEERATLVFKPVSFRLGMFFSLLAAALWAAGGSAAVRRFFRA